MRPHFRVIGTFLAMVGITVVAALLGALLFASYHDCSLNWYDFTCPEWLGPVSATGTFYGFPALILVMLGLAIRKWL